MAGHIAGNTLRDMYLNRVAMGWISVQNNPIGFIRFFLYLHGNPGYGSSV